MKKLFNLKLLTPSSGFTLVELLVVIGILGILAASLLATIDPLEQFRKAQDNTRREASIELVNAITRYFATYTRYPWSRYVIDAEFEVSPVSWAVDWSIKELIASGELKSTYTSNTTLLGELWLSYTGEPGATPTVCFKPESKSLRSDLQATRYYYGDGQEGGGIAGTYWCAK